MKKVSFITIHVGLNFGSILQTIATYELLKEIGTDPICVNYIPPRVSRLAFWNFRAANPIRFLWRLLGRIYTYPLVYKSTKIHQNYLKQHCALSEPVYMEDDFVEKCPQASVYVTGSDQVWNLKHNQGLDTHYFFDGIKGKKVAFASSIGYQETSAIATEAFKKYLPQYSAISVREEGTVEYLKSLGFTSSLLLDPTFSLDKNRWLFYATKHSIIKKPYLLIYTPYNIVDKSQIIKAAKIIAKKKGLKIVTFSWTYYKDHDADITKRFASPGDFLRLMMDADFVITNSFHGTAFSINLNKQFIVYMPSDFTSRILNVLNKFGLVSRIVTTSVIEQDIECDIDYTAINKLLDEERKKNILFLKDAIS